MIKKLTIVHSMHIYIYSCIYIYIYIYICTYIYIFIYVRFVIKNLIMAFNHLICIFCCDTSPGFLLTRHFGQLWTVGLLIWVVLKLTVSQICWPKAFSETTTFLQEYLHLSKLSTCSFVNRHKTKNIPNGAYLGKIS